MTFVAISKFVVRNSMGEEVRQAFRDRPHLVDQAPGFQRMDVLSPLDNSEEFWLITHWDSEEAFRTWHRGHHYKDSHRGIPKGLKLLPSGTEVRHFTHVAS